MNNSGSLKYHIDQLELSTYRLNISGWAIIKDIPSYNSRVMIGLIKEGLKVTITPAIILRSDVTTHINNGEKRKVNYDKSGFKLSIPIQSLPKGEYKACIIVEGKYSSRKKIFLEEYFTTNLHIR